MGSTRNEKDLHAGGSDLLLCNYVAVASNAFDGSVPRLSGRNKNAATFTRTGFVVDYDFHVTIQGCEKPHEPFHRKSLELVVQQR